MNFVIVNQDDNECSDTQNVGNEIKIFCRKCSCLCPIEFKQWFNECIESLYGKDEYKVPYEDCSKPFKFRDGKQSVAL